MGIKKQMDFPLNLYNSIWNASLINCFEYYLWKFSLFSSQDLILSPTRANCYSVPNFRDFFADFATWRFLNIFNWENTTLGL